MSKKIEIEVPDDFYEALEAEAEAMGISLTEVVKRHLEVREETRSWHEIAARLKEFGPSKTKPGDSVRIIHEGRGEYEERSDDESC